VRILPPDFRTRKASCIAFTCCSGVMYMR
jgi:hypothetical protein